MHEVSFLQDLAVVMIAAGIVTVLFQRLKQPVVLGYIVAGILIGPQRDVHVGFSETDVWITLPHFTELAEPIEKIPG